MTLRRRLSGVVLLVASLVITLALPAAGWPQREPEVTIRESGGLSPATLSMVDTAARLGRARSLVIHSGTLRLLAVQRGEIDVQRAPPGFGYPMASMAVDPARARPLLGRYLSEVLRRGEVVMSRRSAELRAARAGDVLTLEGWNGVVAQLRIGAVIPDQHLEWSELMVGAGTAAALGFERPARAEMWDVERPDRLSLIIDRFGGTGPVGVRRAGEGRAGEDWVLPLVMVKEAFGEFAYRPIGRGDAVQIDPQWVDRNIVEVDLAPLGPFRCHREVVPYIRGALNDLAAAGLTAEIDPADFQRAGGCYNPRLMRGGDKGSALSRHSWGIAIDINPSTNRYGEGVSLSPRFGEVFRRWGFAWGAGWLNPDGMHFEWRGLAETESSACPPTVLTGEVYPRLGRCPAS